MKRIHLLSALLTTATICSAMDQTIYIDVKKSKTFDEEQIEHTELLATKLPGNIPVQILRHSSYERQEIISEKSWLQGATKVIPHHFYEGFENKQKMDADKARDLFDQLDTAQ